MKTVIRLGARSALIGVLALLGAACASDAGSGSGGSTPQVSLPNVTLPKVTAPDVSLPKVTGPNVTLPNVTLPSGGSGSGDSGSGDSGSGSANTSGGSSSSGDSAGSGSTQNDPGLNALSIILIVLLVLGVIAVIVSTIRNGRRRGGGDGADLARRTATLDRDVSWALNQAQSALKITDAGQLGAAWPAARDHFQDIEREAASISVDTSDSSLGRAADGVGSAVASLRGALDSFVSASSSSSDMASLVQGQPGQDVNNAVAALESQRRVLSAPGTTTER